MCCPPLKAEEPEAREVSAGGTPAAEDLSEAITDERGRRLLTIYTAAKALIDANVRGDDAAAIATARQHLNTVYDGFVGRYGVISSPANRRRLKDLPELAFLLSLEEDVQTVGKTVRARKSAIFSRSALRAERRVVGDLDAADALLVCLDQHGRIDLEVIGRLSSRTPAQVIGELGDRIYPVPNTRPQAYVTADAYLSGDIRVKLAEAEAMVGIDPAFQRNVEALRAVLPAPIPAQEIMVNLGAAWVPGTDVSAFITSIIPRFNHGVVRYREALGAWDVAASRAAQQSVEAQSTWGTGEIDAISIIEQTLNGKIVKIYDLIQDGDRERRVLNDTATLAAQEKQRLIKERFSAWVWEDPERAERLAAAYNACYNSMRQRQYDGSHLSLAGMNTAILRDGDLSPWQKDAIWQALQTRSTLIGHAVGAGKTFELVAMAREARRMGLARKPLVTVPNHLVEQWAWEAQRLYPGMRVLAMSPEDFQKEKRGIYLSRVATGDWDLVIVAHSSFTRLPVGLATLTRFVNQRVSALRTFLEEVRMEEDANDRGKKRRIKEIERRIAAYELKLKKTRNAITQDSTRTITWDELGVDMLMVDEAHEFKNLEIETRMDTVAGVPRGGSLRAWDLWMKSWEIQGRGGKVVFATGTPVANTLAEVFVMMRYLQNDMLEAKGLAFFDAWVQAFAEATPSFELRPDGSGYRMHTRLNRFINLPELVTLWRQCLNSRTAEQLNLPRPAMVTGSPIPVVIPESPRLKRYVGVLVARVDAIKGGQVPPDVDNMLKVTGDGRKAALDLRQVMDGPEEPQCKINALVARVAKHYRETADERGAQLIFCDLATPKGTAPARSEAPDEDGPETETTAEEQWAQDFVYHEIRDKLVTAGLCREEIAFIHEHPTRVKREALFAAVRAGRVRVLLGSTGKMGTGMNVQDRLIALHHLDAPWRPCDVEQRDGRILRQGNRFGAVFIYHYIQQGSFDGYIWQLLENKARFISQVLAEDVTQRAADDIAEVVLTAGEMKALASGNPRVVEKVKLETELGRLQRLKTAWQQNQRTLDWDCRGLETRISDLTDLIARLQGAQATRDRHGDFAVTVLDPATQEQTRYTGWAEAGSAINQAVGTWLTNQTLRRGEASREVIGTVQGLVIQAVLPAWRQDTDPPELAIVWVTGEEWTRIGTATLGKDKGTTQSIAAVVRGIEEQIERARKRIADSQVDLAGRREEQAKPWDGAATLAKVIAELRRLDAELGEERPADADAAEERTAEDEERVDVAALLSEAAALTATSLEEPATPAAAAQPAAAPGVDDPPAETTVALPAAPEPLVSAGTVDEPPAQEIERRAPDLEDWYAQCGISSSGAPTEPKRRKQHEVDVTTVLDAAENDETPWREVAVKTRRKKGKPGKDAKKVVQYSFLEG